MLPIALATLCVLAAVFGKKLYALVSFLRRRRYLIQLVPEPEPAISRIHGHFSRDNTKVRSQLLSWVSSFPRVVRLHRSLVPMVCVCHPETITQVLRDDPPKNEFFMGFLKEFIGDGLVTSHGKRWHRDRKLLAVLFTGTMLRRYVKDVLAVSEIMIDQMRGHCARGERVDCDACFRRVSFDIIMRCGMGVANDSWTCSASSPAMAYMAAERFMSEATIQRMHNVTQHNNFLFYMTPTGREFARQRRIADDFADGIMAARRQAMENEEEDQEEDSDKRTPTVASNMLDALLRARDEEGRGLSNAEIRDHIATFLAAGHDTSSSALQWMVHYLRSYPDVQERCRDDVVRALDECGGMEQLDGDALSRMHYLTRFVNESLRHATLLPFFVRQLDREVTVDGYALPAGTDMQFMIFSLHHNPTVWEDPEKFDPDRFLPERSARRKPNSFLPFGVGARNCLGKSFALQEIKVVLSAILSNFRILPAGPEEEEPVWTGRFVAWPEPTVQMKLEPLSTSSRKL